MDVVEPMMRGRYGDDSSARSVGRSRTAAQIRHEGIDPSLDGGSDADRDIVRGTRTPFSGVIKKSRPAPRTSSNVSEHRVQLFVSQRTNSHEAARQRLLGRHAINLFLHADMTDRLDLQIPAALLLVEFAAQRPFDVACSVSCPRSVAVIRVTTRHVSASRAAVFGCKARPNAADVVASSPQGLL